MTRSQWAGIALKAGLAAVFFFVLQYAVLKAPVETSLLWAAGLGAAAAMLAWSQAKRGM
jgi:hypothetical protein